MKTKENEEGAEQKDEANEDIAEKVKAKEKDPGYHTVTQEEKAHQPAMQAQGAHDLRFAALGNEGGEDKQISGLNKAEEHDNCSGQDHDDAQDVRHGVGKAPVIHGKRRPFVAL
ncbi:MAG: hypothetical protein WC256_04985 [Desulfurivibrionaceae bacterium]